MSYAGNPNSANQLWSKWTFEVREAGKCPHLADVEYNFAKWCARGFGHSGHVRVDRTIIGWRLELLIEGPPANDPEYVAAVGTSFQNIFVPNGWGIMASGKLTSARVMAGHAEDGKPRAQMVMLPTIPWFRES